MPLILLLFLILSTSGVLADDIGKLIKLPPGFHIEVAVDDVPDARSMALGEDGTLFIATRRVGRLYAVDALESGGFGAPRVIADGLNMPNGIALQGGDLYLAENHRIVRYPDIASHLPGLPEPEQVARLPSERHHGWRYLAFGPDGRLYVSIGAPCNICNEPDFATIIRMHPDGSGRETFAEGVRNSVGFDWQPGSGTLWFSDNGRDWLGDDLPPDELNRAPRPGLHFGYPFCHGGDIADPEYGWQRECGEFIPPVVKLGAHVAALGVRFYTGEQFPEAYRDQLFVAEHGSWNRSEPVGYRVGLVRIEGEKASYQVFAEGWLDANGTVHGRPVDLLLMPDGSLLLSDDHAGVVYRIYYRS